VTRQFTVERGPAGRFGMLLDAGRLSRDGHLSLRRGGVESFAETSAEREAAHVLTVTQLDQGGDRGDDAGRRVIQGSGR